METDPRRPVRSGGSGSEDQMQDTDKMQAAQLPEEHGIKAWFCDMISSIFHTFTPSIVSAINASFTMFLCVRLLDTET